MQSNLIVLKPVFTEKTLSQQENGKYAFWVKKDATKGQIESSFEAVFGVKPLNINTVIVKGKMKTDRQKRLPIKKSDLKKAIISVEKNTKIELLKLNLK
ncbi:MAG: 50S ribosomal protein L23 [Candidatus Shapirobacteria bacterium]|nr:50S ribosomal protein L23 [Candidatus Shapirobacteria bacterium]MDD4410707.1 50S ribosomal protein L23 [Candidatus Shapirobacteria bacterium]